MNIPTTLVAFLALCTGVMINGLGESQQVNLLNFPLLLLLLWNAGLYLFSALLYLLKPSIETTWLDTVATWLSKAAEIWAQRSWPTAHLSETSARPWIQKATKRFMTLWWPHLRPVWTQRLRQLLHLGAACMALGILLGLYIRGLAFDYQATWESTFLSANQVQTVLHILLGPAARLLGYSFPNVSQIISLQAPQHGPAASWIHMWAVTAIVMIVIPRSIMMLMGQRSLKQARETFVLPLDHPYFVRLLAPERGQGMKADVMSYSYQPSQETKEFLNLALLDLFGNLASIQWHQPIRFGQEYSNPAEVSSEVRMSVVIFNAGQTPEGEVQGEWLHSIQTQMNAHRDGSRLLVLLDEEPYSATMDETRVIERRKTWQRLSHQYHLSVVPFHGNTTSLDQFLQQAQAGLWPTPS